MNNLDSSRRSVTSAAKSKNASSKTGTPYPSAICLITFTVLALLVVGIALVVPHQTPEQRLYLRIIIALSVSGLAAIIPGFFDITLRWLRSTVRAGGAIGIFLLVYQFNPPTLPDKCNLQLPLELPGLYTYTFTATSQNFPNGENQHGGEVKLDVNPIGGGLPISALGTRQWAANYENAMTQRTSINAYASWHLTGINYRPPYDFCFAYTTTDKDGTNSGNACLNIYREGNKVVRLVGHFNRNPPYQNISGTVEMIRVSD